MNLRKGDMLECSICGNKIEMLDDGIGPIVCCGQDMEQTS